MSKNQKLTYLYLLCFAYLALTIYWYFQYTGLVQFLGEFEISKFGKQWPVINLIILNIPSLFLERYLRNRLQSKNLDRESSTKRNLSNVLKNKRLINGRLKPIIVLIVMLIMLNITLAQSFSKDLGTISIAQLTEGKIAEHSFYAKISGYPDTKVLEIRKNNEMPIIYIPLRENPQSNTPIHPLLTS